GSGPAVALHIKDHHVERHLVRDPQLALGEAYMDGRLVMQQGGIYDLLEVVLSNSQWQEVPAWTKALDATRYLVRRMIQFNSAGRSRRNVAHHYDIDGSIYDLFLDQDRQYSCGYFEDTDDLDTAQLAKKRHLAAKLAIEPGQRVLDIGSGW